MTDQHSLIPSERIERAIQVIRGQKVILDSDVADLYGVAVHVVRQAVKRNRQRFPADFMFKLTTEETAALSGSTIRRRPPFAFTASGVAMLSTVLQSPVAIQVNIEIVRLSR